jgi:predicted acetyltransferase
VDLELRTIRPDEVPAFTLADNYAFGYRLDGSEGQLHEPWVAGELDRAFAMFEGDDVVGLGRNYSLELTMPGADPIPAGGVSWIGVRPTHRRRGILTRIMTTLLDESVARGEPVSMLTASEGAIYGRFGYGIGSRHRSVSIDVRGARFRDAPPPGRVRLVEADESQRLAPELFERVRRATPGAASRPEHWWPGEWAPAHDVKPRFDVVYERDGRVDGLAVYSVKQEWGGGVPSHTVVVRDVLATTTEAEAALWRFLCEIDLVRAVEAEHVPVDTVLPWLFTDSRRVRTTLLNDWGWVRPLDVPAYLSARRYGTAARLVLEVHDAFRPEGAAAGRFVLDAGPDGAACTRTAEEPDLVLGVGDLGAVSLGDTRPSELVRAGRIEARTDGAAAAADRAFTTDRAPFLLTWF